LLFSGAKVLETGDEKLVFVDLVSFVGVNAEIAVEPVSKGEGLPFVGDVRLEVTGVVSSVAVFTT